jgi:acetyl-CoA C-acetyltransferase
VPEAVIVASAASAQARPAKTAGGGAESWPDPRQDGAMPDIYTAMGHTALERLS